MSLGTLFIQLPPWRLMETSLLKARKSPAINVTALFKPLFAKSTWHGIPFLNVYILLTSPICRTYFGKTYSNLKGKILSVQQAELQSQCNLTLKRILEVRGRQRELIFFTIAVFNIPLTCKDQLSRDRQMVSSLNRQWPNGGLIIYPQPQSVAEEQIEKINKSIHLPY